MTSRVVNKYKEPYDIYIGRGSAWGNPFVIGEHGTREEVIQKYEIMLKNNIRSGAVTIDDLKALDGKVLGCFCKPKPCHGDVIIRAINWAMKQA